MKRREFLVGAASLVTAGGCCSFGKKEPRVWRRLPIETLPENVFCGLSNDDFDVAPEACDRLLDVFAKYSSFNLITFTLRCRKDLYDPVVYRRVGDFAAKAKAVGIHVQMDIDARLARAEFLKRWPEDSQREVVIVTAKPENGKASFTAMADVLHDHMTGGTRDYEATKGRLVAAYALKFDAPGTVNPASVRSVKCTLASQGLPLSGTAEGLQEGETLAVLTEFELFSCDVFSPHLMPFIHEMMKRYAKLPISGAMHDEWGFPPGSRAQMMKNRAFWYSPHYAAAYAQATGGRSLLDDYLLFAFPFTGREAERSLAIRSFMRLNLQRQKEIETDFYDTDKALFGPHTYVTKHATWSSAFCPGEYYHDGLSWWAAKRDWAQTDERAPVPACTGMAKKFGGSCWMNEWYSIDPKTYSRNVWRYALAGGRVVYHGLYGGKVKSFLDSMPVAERKLYQYKCLLSPTAVRAQCRVRLLNLISRGQIDSAAAVVFSHERAMDWNDPAWNDCGVPLMYALWKKGYGADAYPAEEFGEGTFKVDSDGYLRVGQQRYAALALYRLSTAERALYDKLTARRVLKTKIFVFENAFQKTDPAPILEALTAVHAVRQTPFTEDGNTYPAPDGTGTLTDGTVFRISALKNVDGDPLKETLEGAAFKAQGLFAIRKGPGGATEAIAAGGLSSLDAPDLKLRLQSPEDLALWKENGRWRGVWQTHSRTAPVPTALQAIASDWTRLLLPENLI